MISSYFQCPDSEKQQEGSTEFRKRKSPDKANLNFAPVAVRAPGETLLLQTPYIPLTTRLNAWVLLGATVGSPCAGPDDPETMKLARQETDNENERHTDYYDRGPRDRNADGGGILGRPHRGRQ
jgi:hypothetical protein